MAAWPIESVRVGDAEDLHGDREVSQPRDAVAAHKWRLVGAAVQKAVARVGEKGVGLFCIAGCRALLSIASFQYVKTVH